MERCTLCGGKLASNGKCTECGLDNAKSDKKYNLNAHNDSGVSLHQGKCEDNLNHDNGWENVKYSQKKTQGSTSYGSAGQRKPQNSTGSGKTVSVPKDSASAAHGTPKEQAAYARKVRERRQAGTVKKKRSVLKRIIMIIVIIYVIKFLFSLVIGTLMLGDGSYSFLSEWEPGDGIISIIEGFRDAAVLTDNESMEIAYEPDLPGPAVDALWDTSDRDYFETELQYGFYTAGYEFPAGKYQFVCEDGDGWIYWKNPGEEDEHSDCLYSRAEQERYLELMNTDDCMFSEYSPVVELEENSVIYVENRSMKVKLCGQTAGTRNLKSHEPQPELRSVVLDGEMTAGTDFAAGVYDIELGRKEGESLWYAVQITVTPPGKEANPYYVFLDSDFRRCKRFPLEEGSTLKLEDYEEDCTVRLIPSY